MKPVAAGTQCTSRGACGPRLGCMLAASTLLHGCLVVPTPPHGSGLITPDTIETLTVGHTSRVDVLLELADPQERHERDRYFVYEWTETKGYLVWGAYYAGGAGAIEAIRCLVLEFDEAGLLGRKATFSVGSEDDARRQTTAVLDEWAIRSPVTRD